MNYHHFDTFVFRSPLLSISVKEPGLMYEDIVKEAIYLATPDLVLLAEDIQKTNKKEYEPTRIFLAIYKYIIRMRSRCTPFGLFAGCGTGTIGLKNEIYYSGIKNFKSVTRLDMNFLGDLIDSISRDPVIKKNLRYFPNSSLYSLNNAWRFVEYSYRNNQKHYSVSEIESNEVLDFILEKSRPGIYLPDLISQCIAFDYSNEEIAEYLNVLIDNQVLISEIYPRTTGEDILMDLSNKLSAVDGAGNILSVLKEAISIIKQIDATKWGDRKQLFNNLELILRKTNVNYSKKHFVQSDTLIRPDNAALNVNIITSVLKGVETLSRFNNFSDLAPLEQFRVAFYNRYDEEEISLTEVMDTDIGIGFGKQIPGNTESLPLIDNIHNALNNSESTPASTRIRIEQFLLAKYIDSIKTNEKIVRLTKDELAAFPSRMENIAPAFSAFLEILDTRSNDPESLPLIHCKGIGGISAACLIGRFGHLSQELNDHLKSITKFEKEYAQPDAILAEIIHLPESRLGNVLLRPTIRDYEINYLATPSVSEENQIPITDIMVSVKNGRRIVLRSKKLDKEIIPRLTTAHNFNTSSLPIYNFLCSVQYQYTEYGLAFNWGKLVGQKQFLPRVVYDNIVLFPAEWNFEEKDIAELKGLKPDELEEKMKHFFKVHDLPVIFYLCLGDNKLLIDTSDIMSLRVFYSEIMKHSFRIEEYLFNDSSPLIKSQEGPYTNEVLLSFYKKS